MESCVALKKQATSLPATDPVANRRRASKAGPKSTLERDSLVDRLWTLPGQAT
jgi:hypothetical protein